VGAGLSGIGGACHLKMECPAKSFVILEGRESMGGTWDLSRYPGIRSDSDMHTLGYRFRPWRDAKAIADGPAILNYIHDTAAEYDVDKAIRYNQRVRSASWSPDQAHWTIEIETGEKLTCNFLYLCTGYYDYANGYTPEWPGVERFRGTIVHPQKWPEDLDYTDKRVVVIGSGATAITLVPAMAQRAASGIGRAIAVSDNPQKPHGGKDLSLGLGNSPRRFMSNGKVGVLFYLSDCCGIIDSLTTVRTLVQLHGRSRITLALASSGNGFTNCFQVFVATVRANS